MPPTLAPMPTLVLLRHGQSTWNAENRFTGWHDVPLTDAGRAEARQAGELMAAADLAVDVVHTSLQQRAITTGNLALEALERLWVPQRRHWRLNERHYGDLEGRDKAETAQRYGADQVQRWRRSYRVAPPALAPEDPRHPSHDVRYATLAPDLLPGGECLADVVARMIPYWHDSIAVDLLAGKRVLVAAHGNSLRALVKHLDGMSEDDVIGLNIPTGVPLRYDLDSDLRPRRIGGSYLDPDAAAAAIEAVKNQGRR